MRGKHSHHEIALNQIALTQQNARKRPMNQFYEGWFTALVTAFGNTNFVFNVSIYYTYQKHT